AIERVGAEWDRDKFFVGRILEVRPHPNADRLVIAVVDYGAEEPLAVVTGAPNVKVGHRGQRVAFAKVGARLIDGHAKELRYFTLKPATIRGVRSEGMLCSEKELGISEEHEGIMILSDDAPVGTPLADYLGDTVLEFDLTPNLAHCFCILGVAREIAALTGQEMKIKTPSPSLPQFPSTPFVDVEIADLDLCPRYSAALVKDVKIGPSPFWVQHRLTLAGMRPINNIVDTTNYVMLKLGQPLHAFDYDKLHCRGGTPCPPVIIVRRARPGERVTTLDSVERELTEDMLLITDPSGPIAIAGVMGGLETEVTNETTNVLIEAANFDNISVRRTSWALKLPTEAAARFGRGVAPQLTTIALARACKLMEEFADGAAEESFADAYPVKPETKTIEFKPHEVERILGIRIPIEETVRILRSLEFKASEERVMSNEGTLATRLLVTVPYYRLDVSIPADLIEEVARVYGYDRLPSVLLSDELPPQHRNLALEGEERVRDILAGCGLQEVITYSLTSLESAAKLTPGEPIDESQYIKLANPLSSERAYMRRTLMASLLETLRDNLRFRDRVAIFEIGRVYLPRDVGVQHAEPLLPHEPRRLGIAMTGLRMERSWLTGSPELMDFFDLKGMVETLLDRLGTENYVFLPTEHSTFHPGRVAELRLSAISHQPLAILGEVHPLVREAFDLPAQPVCLAEFDLEALLKPFGGARHFEPIPRFPAVTQDLALVVDEGLPAQEVLDAIVEAGGRLLRRVELFDLYRREPIPAGKKSLAYSLTYQAEDRTLTDEEVAQAQERIVRHLAEKLGAELRS
ncbi:MAG: phenylalanine--tRNA ligase subunit beta, partial [Chloroflexota bacterium]|nr:phenylalanine--tRNA ligase subunit beta [Chloroflexota bacterium]